MNVFYAMKYDLKTVRESYGMSMSEFAKYAGITEYYYRRYESTGVIPCKYIYALWKSLSTSEKEFPIPEDFFHYTSTTLIINMAYNRMSQWDVAKLFGTKQSTISSYCCKPPMPMYELKDKFIKAFPNMIIPYTCNGKVPEILQELRIRGNFVANERKREYAKYRKDTGLTVNEHRQLRERKDPKPAKVTYSNASLAQMFQNA